MSNFRKYWHVFWQFRRFDIMKMLTYPTDFFFWMSVSLLWTSFNFLFMTLFIHIEPNLAGWSATELYLFLGIFTTIDGFLWGFMFQNMKLYIRGIFSGDMSIWLTKPIDIQFVQQTQVTSLSNLPRIIVGCLLVIHYSAQLPTPPTLIQVITASIAMGISCIFIYSGWFLIATSAFFVEKADTLNLFVPELRQIWQTPGTFFTGSLGLILHSLLPLGLITTLPTNFLRSAGSATDLAFYLIYTVLLFYCSRKALLFALRSYTAPLG